MAAHDPHRRRSRSRMPRRAAKARAAPSHCSGSSPPASRCAGARPIVRASSSSSGPSRLAITATGPAGATSPSSHGSLCLRRSNRRTAISAPLAAALAPAASTLALDNEREHGREPQPRGGYRQHPRAGADVQQRSPRRLERRQLEQQGKAQAGAGMRAGSERLPGVDHELLDGVAACARLLPRGAHPQGRHRACASGPTPWRLYQDRAVKSPPALLPVVGDLAARDLHERAAHSRLQVGQGGQLTRRPVGRVLHRLVRKAHLFHAGRRELQQLRQGELRVLAADADREADHAAWLPSALRSLANSDSSERMFSGVRESFRRSSSSRCSSLRRRGTRTFTTARRSPRRPLLTVGMP